MQQKSPKINLPIESGTLSVHGVSYIEVNSDRVRLRVKISLDESSLEKGLEQVNNTFNNIQTSLLDFKIPKDNIINDDLSVLKNYDYQSSTQPTYKISKSISILVDNLKDLSSLYSLLIENGANDVSVEFLLTNPSLHYNKALAKAVQDALNKASIIAKNANIKYNPTPKKLMELSSALYSITYSSNSIEGYQDVSPGLVKVTAEVEATFSTYPY